MSSPPPKTYSSKRTSLDPKRPQSVSAVPGTVRRTGDVQGGGFPGACALQLVQTRNVCEGRYLPEDVVLPVAAGMLPERPVVPAVWDSAQYAGEKLVTCDLQWTSYQWSTMQDRLSPSISVSTTVLGCSHARGLQESANHIDHMIAK